VERKGEESSMEVENGGVSLVPQKYIIALAPLPFTAPVKKNIATFAGLMRYFSPPLPPYRGEKGKPLPACRASELLRRPTESDSDFPTKRQPVKSTTNVWDRKEQCSIRDSSLTLLPSAAFRKFLIQGEEAEMISTPPSTSTPPSPSP
jgi:hypothetical protein